MTAETLMPEETMAGDDDDVELLRQHRNALAQIYQEWNAISELGEMLRGSGGDAAPIENFSLFAAQVRPHLEAITRAIRQAREVLSRLQDRGSVLAEVIAVWSEELDTKDEVVRNIEETIARQLPCAARLN